MEIGMHVIIIMTIYAGVAHLDALSTQLGLFTPLFAGTVTGALMGDLATGLTIGATLQLATLGIATYGGASVPDFLSGAIIGTAIGIITGDVALGLALAATIGLLLTQFDVFARMINVGFQHMADKAIEKGNTKRVEMANLLGALCWAASRAIPVCIGLAAGTAVGDVAGIIPVWFITGLRYAGQLLPAMGIAILMRYLPLKRFYPFFIIGFVLMAYAPVTVSYNVLGIALLGFALAAIYIMYIKNSGEAVHNEMEVEIDG